MEVNLIRLAPVLLKRDYKLTIILLPKILLGHNSYRQSHLAPSSNLPLVALPFKCAAALQQQPKHARLVHSICRNSRNIRVKDIIRHLPGDSVLTGTSVLQQPCPPTRWVACTTASSTGTRPRKLYSFHDWRLYQVTNCGIKCWTYSVYTHKINSPEIDQRFKIYSLTSMSCTSQEIIEITIKEDKLQQELLLLG